MKSVKEIYKLNPLFQKPLFHSAEAMKEGVSSSLLNYYVKKNLIVRLDRGIYRGRDSAVDIDSHYEDLVLAVKSIPSGVVCLVSALDLYGLTDEIPRKYWIAVPNTMRAPIRKNVRILRMRNTSLGLTEMRIGSETIRIFDRERTIIDAFRHLGIETAVKAMKAGISKKGAEKIDMRKLRDYAVKLRVNIDPYLIAVTV